MQISGASSSVNPIANVSARAAEGEGTAWCASRAEHREGHEAAQQEHGAAGRGTVRFRSGQLQPGRLSLVYRQGLFQGRGGRQADEEHEARAEQHSHPTRRSRSLEDECR